MQEQIFSVNKSKAEAPLYTLFILGAIIGFLSLFSFGLVWIVSYGVLLSLSFAVVRTRLTGPYFIKVNDAGISFRTSILEKPAFLSWDMVNQVNFHLYEVNLRLNETNNVVNLQTNYLKKEERDIFVALIKTQFKRITKQDIGL
jgi:hypothetical protein